MFQNLLSELHIRSLHTLYYDLVFFGFESKGIEKIGLAIRETMYDFVYGARWLVSQTRALFLTGKPNLFPPHTKEMVWFRRPEDGTVFP